MHTIDELLDLAKSRNMLPSDRELAARLGVRHAHQYRTKGVIPNDTTALRLAELCGLPAVEVLITCHMLKAETEAVKSAWLEVMKRTAAALLLVFFSVGTSSATPAPVHPETCKNIHYATRRRTVLA